MVEAGLGCGDVGDVGLVGDLAFVCGCLLLDGGDGEAEGFVGRAHPFGVAAGEIVIGGEDVDALFLLGEDGGGGHGGEGFAFACLHFHDAAPEKGFGALELGGEEFQAQGTLCRVDGGAEVDRHGFSFKLRWRGVGRGLGEGGRGALEVGAVEAGAGGGLGGRSWVCKAVGFGFVAGGVALLFLLGAGGRYCGRTMEGDGTGGCGRRLKERREEDQQCGHAGEHAFRVAGGGQSVAGWR